MLPSILTAIAPKIKRDSQMQGGLGPSGFIDETYNGVFQQMFGKQPDDYPLGGRPTISHPQGAAPIGRQDEMPGDPLHGVVPASVKYGQQPPQNDPVQNAPVPQVAQQDAPQTQMPVEAENPAAGIVPGKEVDPLDDAYNRRNELAKNGAKRESSFGKRLLQGVLRGASGGLGGILAGALIEGFDPSANRRMNTTNQLSRVDREIQGLEGQRTASQKQKESEARIRNIIEDNARMGEESASRAEERRQRIKNQRRAIWFRNNQNFDPAKATEAQKRELADFGETPESIGRYDLKDPKTKRIGDTEFQWDRNANAWVDSGLPKNSPEAFTEIVVTDPETKKQYTFVTSQQKAAGLVNARQVAGMQIEAARDRQLTQQNFTAGENQKDRAFRSAMEAAKMQYGAALKQFDAANGRAKTIERARTAFVAAYQRANGTPPDEAQIGEYLAAIVADLDN